ncbi:MAG TPA: hypothetical protein VGC89_03025 [Pyrinomonadaceae bacterium]|jgi:hypothetical protein
MPTSTPPPYFPQTSLSPPDPKAAAKKKLMWIGCLALSLLLLAGFIVGAVYLIRLLF